VLIVPVESSRKARLPTVDSLTEGTTSRLVPAERSDRRPEKQTEEQMLEDSKLYASCS